MQHFSFMVGVTGINLEQSYEDALFEAGCADALIIVVDGQLRLDFDREAQSYEMAVDSAVRNIVEAGGKVEYVEPVNTYRAA